jgi:hypothetical protein
MTFFVQYHIIDETYYTFIFECKISNNGMLNFIQTQWFAVNLVVPGAQKSSNIELFSVSENVIEIIIVMNGAHNNNFNININNNSNINKNSTKGNEKVRWFGQGCFHVKRPALLTSRNLIWKDKQDS